MSAKILRARLSESTNIWPGFVDILATLLIVIIFILMIFTVSQIYLSDAISGRDRALEDLRNQIQELSKILVFESKEKQKVLQSLSETESELLSEQELTLQLESQITEGQKTISSQSKNISVLSSQIDDLLSELRIVAKALETYEGIEVTSLETKGLGERINKALAAKIDQLNSLNKQLALTNEELELSKQQISKQFEQLALTNEELELSKQQISKQFEQLALTNEELELSKQQISKQLKTVEELNILLNLNEEELQKQVNQYKLLTQELIALNDSLDLKDKALIDQLQLIKNKNTELSILNENLIKKDSTIFDLRGKILELNNILSISEDTKLAQTIEIENLGEKIQILEQKTDNSLSKEQELNKKIATLENEKKQLLESSNQEILEAQMKASSTLKQVEFLSNEIEILKNEINILNSALEASEQSVLAKELKIEVLGERLNKALTSKVFELQKYRSEFFGRLQAILGERKDIKIVGDRFIFESELLFDSGSATLQNEGKLKLKQIGLTLKETTKTIPEDIDWIIQVEGHTDKNPINTTQFPSNWELSTARANTVLKLLLGLGFDPQRLSAAGYGEFYPISKGKTLIDFQQNRRIELKLTSR